ncbi:GNAT family N-acetyltransferase [Spirillospora sp. NPDC052269]
MNINGSRDTGESAAQAARPCSETTARLAPPTEEVHASYLAALEEYRAEGKYPDLENLDVAAPAAFAQHVATLRRDGYVEPPEAPWDVPMTLLWFVREGEYLGRLSIRHRLTPTLEESGGHIGYDVRPSARGHGHATQMLRESLPVASDLGVGRALMICGESNTASRRVIERNGGKLWDQRDHRLYFWLPTSP